MEKADYPMLDAHREVRETFKERANELLQKLHDCTTAPTDLAQQSWTRV